MKRAVSRLGLTCVGATALLALTAGPAMAATSDTTPENSAVVITPERELFNVHLHPGDVVVGNATISNHSAGDARITLTADIVKWAGSQSLGSMLQVSFARIDQCDSGALRDADTIPLAALSNLSVGHVGPGENANICIAVQLPADADVTGPVSATVDFNFQSMVSGAAPSSPGSLPHTGGTLPWSLAAAAGLLIILGAALRRATRPDPTGASND